MPSSRFRVGQLVPAFEGAGVRCTVRAPYPSVAGDVDWRFIRGGWRELARPFSVPSRLAQLPLVRKHDLLFIQRPLVRYYTTVMEEVVTRLRPSLFDIDDAIFHNFFGWERFKIRRIVSLCRHLIAGNRYLAEFFDQPERTTIIPTVVDTDRYTPRPDPEGPFTVGWTGLSSNLKEFATILAPLGQALRETGGRLLIVADHLDAPWARDLPVEFVKWSPTSEVEALGRAHVGVMPLHDTRYNRGKCGFKLIQYMARGIPVVAAPVGANNDIVRPGVDGYLAGSDQQWVDALVALARSPEERTRMGAAARQRIEERYSTRAVIPVYLDLFRRLHAGQA